MNAKSISLQCVWNSTNLWNKQLLLLLILSALVLLIVVCSAYEEQKNLAQKAIGKIDACRTEGDKPLMLKDKCLVWDLGANSLHRAHDLLDESLKYDGGAVTVTIFLVTAKQSQRVGNYSISGQPAYREWVDIYVVESPDFKAIGAYEVVSLDPRQSRPVQYNPEYGDVAPPIAKWIESFPKQQPKTAKEYYNRGLAYGKKGDYDRAIQDYDQAISLDPKDAKAYNNRGTSYGNKGDHDRAIQDYDQAISLDPKDATIYFNRGLAYGKKDDYDRAIQDYDQAISLDPKLAKAYELRSEAYRALGKNDLYAMGKIVRFDPRFDQLIAPDTKIEKLTEEHKWTDGPVWNKRDGYLLYSDTPNNAIFKYQPGKKETIFQQPAGYTGKEPFRGREPGASGLTYNKDGLLISCEQGDRRVTRLEANSKSKTTLANKYDGKRFNSPNDLVFKSNGDLYFTDPPYGLPNGADDPARELEFCGVYRLSNDGKVMLLTKEITRPNGIAFSPDERKLYVANSDPDKATWMVYEVKPDGTLASGKVFKDVTPWVKEKRPGLPAGMKVDVSGNLWATGPGGVLVFAPDGTHLGSIETSVPTANCAFGEDGTVLYITANTALLRVKTGTKGLGF